MKKKSIFNYIIGDESSINVSKSHKIKIDNIIKYIDLNSKKFRADWCSSDPKIIPLKHYLD